MKEIIEFDFILEKLVETGMSESEAEEHIYNLLAQESQFYLDCMKTLEPLNNMDENERKKLLEYIEKEKNKNLN